MSVNLYDVAIQNANGDVLTLTGQEDKWKITSIIGLNPPQAQINTSTVAGMDGAKYNSSKLETRNIVITLSLQGNIEANRQELYFYVRTKEFCTFYFTNENRDVYIDAYVENVECNLFNKGEVMQISLLCPYPYFKNIDEILTDISKVSAAFAFPFSIENNNPIPFGIYDKLKITDVVNDSDSETGAIIEIEFLSSVNKITIQNTDTGETMSLKYNFIANDIVTINTNKGEKSITLLRDGVTSNVFSSIVKGSTFFQLSIGDNLFSYSADDGASDDSVDIVFKYYTIFRGV